MTASRLHTMPAAMVMNTIAVLSITLNLVHCATTVVEVPTLPYEFHSFNDIDAWPGVLAVGTRWFKLDLGLCVKDSCTGYSTFGRTDLPGYRGNTSDCTTIGTEEYCCICMRGDASTRPYLADSFNTSWDMIAWFASAPATVPRISDVENNLTTPLRIGFDWGDDTIPTCDGGLAQNNPPCPTFPFIAEWLLALNATIVEAGLAVEPYFDDVLNSWFLGLDQTCGPTTSAATTNNYNCSPLQLQLQALSWPVEVGPPFPPLSSDPAGRVRIPNDGWTSLPNDCAGGDGWFTQANTDTRAGALQPYLWWEQEDQSEFFTLLENWETCAKQGNVPPEKVNVNTGMIAVSNVNPAMFEVFTSSFTGRGLNVIFTNSTAATLQGEAKEEEDGRRRRRNRESGMKESSTVISSSSSSASLPSSVSISDLKLSWPLLVIIDAASPSPPPASPDRWVFLAATDDSTNTAILSSFSLVDGQAPQMMTSGENTTVALPFAGPLASFTLFRGANNTHVISANNSNGILASLFAYENAQFSIATLDSTTGSVDSTSPVVALGGTSVMPTGSALLGASIICGEADGDDVVSSCIILSLVTTSPSSTSNGSLNITASSLANPTVSLSTVMIQNSFYVDAGASMALDALRSLNTFRNSPSTTSFSVTTFEGLVIYASSAANANASSSSAEAAAAPYRSNFATSSYVPAGGIRSELFGASLNVNITTSPSAPISVSLSVKRKGMDAFSPPTRIGFGSRPHLSNVVATSSSSPSFTSLNSYLLVSTDSDCDCGLLLNNADFSRCELHDPEVDWNPLYSLFQSVTWLLTYSYGSLQDWDLLVQGGEKRGEKNSNIKPSEKMTSKNYDNNTIKDVEYWDPTLALGACHPTIAHGKFETGTSVSAFPFPWLVSHPNGTRLKDGTELFGDPVMEVGLLAVHDGNIWGALQTTILCGMPNFKPGLVWDSWRLPQTPLR